jgi:hypothetical protein
VFAANNIRAGCGAKLKAPDLKGHQFEIGEIPGQAIEAAKYIRVRLPRKKSDLRQINRLIELTDKTLVAQASELKALEEELNGIIAWFVKGQASGTADSPAFSIAIAHAQHAIEKQREALRQGQTGSMPQQQP